MIVVTGANGFIGSALIWELNRQGFSEILAVDAVDIKQRPALLKNLRFREFMGHKRFLLSLGSSKESKNLAMNLSAIFHIGACSTTTEKNWDFLQEVNVDYTQKIFQWCSEHQVPLIYASSAAVYGDGKKGFEDAQNPGVYTPLNLYGKSKLIVDQWALGQSNTPPHWYGLRYFNVFGPNEYFKGDMASLVYKAYLQILDSGKLKLFKSYHPKFDDGKQMRDFVYVKDVTRWMWEILSRGLSGRWAESGIYNMGSGRARTWLDLANAIFAAMERPLNVEMIEMPESLRSQYQYFTEAPMTKWFKQGLSNPDWDLERAVEDYIRNHLMRPEIHLHL